MEVTLIIMLVGAILNGWLASSRGRRALPWAILGAFFGLLSLLLLVLLPNLNAEASAGERLAAAEHKLRLAEIRAEQTADRGKSCPMCAETVKSAAKICKFCGHQFEEPRPQPVVVDPNVAERGEYLGVEFTQFVDGSVTASINDEVMTWPSPQKFRYYVYNTSREDRRRASGPPDPHPS